MAQLPSSVQQIVAGFIDGDGPIGMKPPRKRDPRPIPFVSIKQSCNAGPPPELLYVQSHCGGSLSLTRPRIGALRDQWELRVTKELESTALLRVLSQHGIVKRQEADIALAYLINGRMNPAEAHAALAAAKIDRQDVDIDAQKLSVTYITGLFVAEGSVFIAGPKHQPIVTITQLCCVNLLRAIRDRFNYGCVVNGELRLSGLQTLNFLGEVTPYLFGQKRPQAEAILTYIRGRQSGKGRKRTREQIQEAEQCKKQLQSLKKT